MDECICNFLQYTMYTCRSQDLDAGSLPEGQGGERRAVAPSTSGSGSSASSQTLTTPTPTFHTEGSLVRSTTPNKLTLAKGIQLNSSFPDNFTSDGQCRSRTRVRGDSFSSWSSKSPGTPLNISKPPPTPGNNVFTPSIRPIEISTITSAQMKQSNQIISLSQPKEMGTLTASGGQQLNMEMVRRGGFNKQALPPSSETPRFVVS